MLRNPELVLNINSIAELDKYIPETILPNKTMHKYVPKQNSENTVVKAFVEKQALQK